VSITEPAGLEDGGITARMGTLLQAPALLLWPERLLLYALVTALRPARCLEIGTRLGGSAEIICSALEDVGTGRLVCIDPRAEVAAARWQALEPRATLIRRPSPGSLCEARRTAGAPFDFVFIDGDHTQAGVSADLEGVLGVTAPGATIVLHDAHYFGVAAAVTDVLGRRPLELIDCGLVSTSSTEPRIDRSGRTEVWAGLRMLRVPATTPLVSWA
jgi:cephalosporin hydroxylase